LLEIKKYDLAQHCFLKSLQINDNNVVSLTNLGIFYIINNEIKLAHNCLSMSQAVDPEYGVAWIGQVRKLQFINDMDKTIYYFYIAT
jgi:superkiller protein 3